MAKMVDGKTIKELETRAKTAETFYDPAVATKELVDEVFEITNSRIKVIKIIALAKSAIRHNLGDELGQIKVPTLLIWGKNDKVTPPFVAEDFHKLIPNSELAFTCLESNSICSMLISVLPDTVRKGMV